jgi:phage terminase large subunit-like protein
VTREHQQAEARAARRVERFFTRHLRHSMSGGRRWAGQPFTLERFQRDEIIRPIFGPLNRDLTRRIRLAYIGEPRKNGKALDVDTPILSGRGWTTMGELRPGDQVHAVDGRLTRVRFVSERHHRSCFRVRFADGAELIASDHHLWTVNDRMRGRQRVITTTELLDTLNATGARGDRRYTVDVPAPLERPAADLPVDPYVLGVWLGDGSSYKAEVTGADPEVFDAITAAGYQLSYDYGAGAACTRGIRGGLYVQLRALGVLRNKHVPDQYMLASADQRLELLRGLMDTDGSVNRCGTGAPRVEFTSTTRQLADDVQLLARSLGWKPTLREGAATLDGRVISPKYRVAWAAYSDCSPFRLARKTALLRPEPAARHRSRTNAVVAVDPVPMVESVCIQVEHPSSTFLAGRSLTPTHNTEIAAGCMLYLLTADNEPGAEVYSLAGSRGQARLVFKVAKQMVEASPLLRAGTRRYKDAIEVPETDSVYRVLAADAGLQQGLNPHGFCVDEYHVHRNAEQYEAMVSGTGARVQPLGMVITTAGPKRMGPAWDLLQLAKAGGDPEMYLRWWAADDGCDLWDTKQWRKANPASWVTIKYLRGQARRLPEPVFRRLHLNQWWDREERWIRQDTWDANDGRPSIDPDLPCYIGVDAAPKRDTTAVVLLQRDDQGVHHVRVKVWRRDETMAYTDFAEVEDYIRTLCTEFQVERVVVDPYAMIRSMMMLADEGLPVEDFPQNDARMVPASQNLYDIAMERRLRHGGDRELSMAAENAGVLLTNRGWRLNKMKSSGHIDALVALSMCAYLAEQDAGVARPGAILV